MVVRGAQEPRREVAERHELFACKHEIFGFEQISDADRAGGQLLPVAFRKLCRALSSEQCARASLASDCHTFSARVLLRLYWNTLIFR